MAGSSIQAVCVGRYPSAGALGRLLWLPAGGFGLWQAGTSYEPEWTSRPHHELVAVAERFAPDQRQPAATVIEQAAAEFPVFGDVIMELCR